MKIQATSLTELALKSESELAEYTGQLILTTSSWNIDKAIGTSSMLDFEHG